MEMATVPIHNTSKTLYLHMLYIALRSYDIIRYRTREYFGVGKIGRFGKLLALFQYFTHQLFIFRNIKTFPVKNFVKLKLFTFFNSPPFPTKKVSSSCLGEGPSNIAALQNCRTHYFGPPCLINT